MVQIATDEDFKQLLEANDQVIVKFFADWCGDCKLISPQFEHLSTSQKYEHIAFLEVNSEYNKMARKSGGVYHLPYFAIYEKGKLVKGITTGLEHKLIELLNQFTSLTK